MNNKTYLHHTAIQVKDIKTSVDFYVLTFDAKVLHEDSTWALLSLNTETKLALVLPSEHPRHIAIVSKLASAYQYEFEEHRDGIKYKYIKDPSGNVIELLDPDSVDSSQ